MSIMQQYKDVCDKTDRKVLRPIVFDSIQELHTILSNMLSNNESLTIFRYNRRGLYDTNPIVDIDLICDYDIQLKLYNSSALYISKNIACKFYTNMDHSILVINDTNIPGRNISTVWIIKDR